MNLSNARASLSDSGLNPITERFLSEVIEPYGAWVLEYQRDMANKVKTYPGKGWAIPLHWEVVITTPTEELAMAALATAMHHVPSLMTYTNNGVGRAALDVAVGNAVTHHRMVKRIIKANVDKYGRSIQFNESTGRKLRYIAAKAGVSLDDGLELTAVARLGADLVNGIVETTGLFTYGTIPVKGKRPMSALFVTPAFMNWFDEGLEALEEGYGLYNPVAPMVCPPLDWDENGQGGGYLSGNPAFDHQLIKRKKTRTRGTAGIDFIEAANHLQRTPFRINKSAFEELAALKNAGREAAGLPGEVLPLPDFAENLITQEQYREVCAARRLIHEANATTEGRRVQTSLLYKEADKLKEFGGIWFPHNTDFRSRIYPLPGRISTQGADSSRGMLEFADGLPLGERGLYWLKVHVANCLGTDDHDGVAIDKKSFSDRVAFTDRLMTDIVRRPLEEFKEWQDDAVDKPFHALAAVHDLWHALQLDDPESHVSHLPIAMDGSCNGMQHLAAMGRDRIAGAEVNLINGPDDIPGDLYTLVLKAVQKQIKADVAKGETMAMAWDGYVTRKTVKRGVMTTPYGVRPFGMADQLIGDGFTQGLGEHEKLLASYMATQINDALGEVFGPGKAIMDWLKEAVKCIHEADADPEWTTPIGFNVLQNYVKRSFPKYQYYDQNGKRKERQLNEWRVNGARWKEKNTSGISPNFVHSIDAAHLMGTVLGLKDAGVDHFHAIHDSFGVHACHVDLMHETLRDQFVLIHSADPLERFKEENEARLNIKLPLLPPRGDLDITEIHTSKYLFS